ncbi:RNA recognition motif-containing protein [Toxoplasma gondii MAS]|uniref:RNA recognition motif-containing protein n=1 Tax=Toxoplasma gondii MAS TaxID=943118 RepID=A0A086PRC5_TOXGO|nr:RNA recognition motif-containing protein [Toxoplasma gondii MAS]
MAMEKKRSGFKRGSASTSAARAEASDHREAPDGGFSETAETLVHREFAGEKQHHQSKRRKVMGDERRHEGPEDGFFSPVTSPDNRGRGMASREGQQQVFQKKRGKSNSTSANLPQASRDPEKKLGSLAGGGDGRTCGPQQESRRQRGKELDMFSDENIQKGNGKLAAKNRKALEDRRQSGERPGGKRWNGRAVDVPPDYRSSRLIVKNLPPYITTAELKQKLSSLGGEITDVCLLRNERGKSRQCAFVGFKTQEQAMNVKDHFQSTFIHTRKVEISYALPRTTLSPSERGEAGSDGAGGAKAENAKNADSSNRGKKVVKRAGLPRGTGEAKGKVTVVEEESVGARKAGVSSVRTRVLFDDDSDSEESSGESDADDNEDGKKEKHQRKKATVSSDTISGADDSKSGDDEEIDDLAWLRQQSARTALAESADSLTNADAEDTPVSRRPDDTRDGGGAADSTEMAENEAADLALLGSHGRLLIQNLPFATTVDELRALCEEYGEVAETHLVVDEETQRPRGFGFVSFVFPEHAVASLPRLNGSIFQGRILRAFPARPDATRERRLQLREERRLARQKKLAGSSYKARKLQQLVSQDEQFAAEKVWNLLYVSANSAADAVLSELQADKAALLLDGEDAGRKGKALMDEGAGNLAGKNTAAATVALMEAHLLTQTRAWIKAEGISLEAFERRGNTLLTATYRQSSGTGQENPGSGTATGSGRGNQEKKEGSRSDIARSRDTLIVKHLPTAHVNEAELLRLFERVGPLARFLLAPSKTVAIVQYEREKDAEVAFRHLAYRQYKNVPLFLEKAPVNVFVEREEEIEAARKGAVEEVRAAKIAERGVGDGGSKNERQKKLAGSDDPKQTSACDWERQQPQRSSSRNASDVAVASRQKSLGSHSLDSSESGPAKQDPPTSLKKRKVKEIETIGNDVPGDFEEEVQGVSLFVKNVNFCTSEATLNDVFAGCPGLRRTILMVKKKAVSSSAAEATENGDAQTLLSMGYAFVEFDSAENALAACKRMQGVVVDDHVLQISISKAAGRRPRGEPGTGVKVRGGASSGSGKSQAQSNKVLVRNLAFQASASDLRGLFSAYGNVTRVCIPRQHEGRSRGFGFVDFATKQEAQNAVEALTGSHLYGRRLVLEPAQLEQVSKKASV